MQLALTTPVLFNLPAFDAKDGYTFKFNVIGGSLVAGNRLIIRRSSDNVIVYSVSQTTDEYKHVLPPNKLKNNTYYNAVIVTLDSQGNESSPSTPIQFWCYTKPTIKFNNLIENQTIDKPSYTFEFEYNQVEGEKLNSYKLNLFDITGKQIVTSGNKIPTSATVPYTDTYNFAGLVDNTVYSVELIGVTVQDTIISTGKIKFNVKYSQQPFYSLFEAKNNCKEGYILVSSNVSLIEGEANGKPIFIDDHEINVKGEDDYVKFDKGYSIQGDFALRAWFRSPNVNNTLIKLSNGRDNIFINVHEVVEVTSCEIPWNNDYVDNPSETFWNEENGCNLDWNSDGPIITKKVYAELYAESGMDKRYYIYSDYIPSLPDDEYYVLLVRREKNLYDIEITNKGA